MGKNERQVERFNFAVVATFEHEYAADVAGLSAFAPHEGDYFGGGDVTLPDGYLALLESLTDGIQIQLGNRVTGVTTHATGVTLDSAGAQTTHDHSVVTLPLGVMKTEAVRFEPPLPAEKQAAMKRFGMGLLNKVVLESPEVFWDRNYEWFGYVGPDIGAWSQWFDLTDVSGRPCSCVSMREEQPKTSKPWRFCAPPSVERDLRVSPMKG